MKGHAVKAERERKRAGAGVVHIDWHGEPCLWTGEALRALLYPQEAHANARARQIISQRIRSLFPAGPLAEETAPSGNFISGRRRYAYHTYPLGIAPRREDKFAAVIILERDSQRLIPAAGPLGRFHLTVREEQVLRGLLQGLSNKEIAQSMAISPNTVKTFLRLIMTKLGVSNRFGILARVMEPTLSRRPPGPPRPAAMSVTRFPIARNL